MEEFDFLMGANIWFGAGRINDIGQLIKSKYDNHKILVFAGNHCLKNGLTERIERSLKQADCKCSVTIRGGVQPESNVIDGLVSRYGDDEINLIIAVGGGSVIDTAKAFSVAYSERERIWDLLEGKRKINNAIDIIAIPTTPASGSESNGSTVITNPKIKVKRGMSSSFLVPRYAVLDPELTCSLTEKETIKSATDIMFHSIERFLSTDDSVLTVSDMISVAVIKNVMVLVPTILSEPDDISARGEMMWCGFLSNCGLTGLGRKVEFPIHQLGHQISVFYNVPHADSLTSVWKSWADYVKKEHYKRFAKLGKSIFEFSGNEEKEIANATISVLNDLWEKWGMPTSLRECFNQLSDESMYSLIDSITNHGKRIIGNHWHMNHDDVSCIIARAAI